MPLGQIDKFILISITRHRENPNINFTRILPFNHGALARNRAGSAASGPAAGTTLQWLFTNLSKRYQFLILFLSPELCQDSSWRPRFWSAPPHI